MYLQSDDSPAVPKFGDWDESDPASAEGYSQIFDKVREEKQTGAAKVPGTSTDTSYSNSQKRYGNDSAKVCRFGFLIWQSPSPNPLSRGRQWLFPILVTRTPNLIVCNSFVLDQASFKYAAV